MTLVNKVHGRNIAKRVPCKMSIHDKFVAFAATLGKTFGVSLDVPRFEHVIDIKKFCSGLLEGQNHPWADAIKRLPVRSRYSIGHSLFLFRKVIPCEAPSVELYVRRMCQPQDEADPKFVDFCRKSVRSMFRYGWDRTYDRKVTSATLPLSACRETSRQGGGCRGLDADRRWQREDFCSYVSEAVAPRPRGASKVQAIETGGKWRVISIPPRIDNALRPLHQVLYDHISRQDWCLRGDASPRRFKGFTRNGEIFVSGDYESATDNLNSEVQYAILDELLKRSVSVPQGIRSHALSTFQSLLECDGFSGKQQRGQLMGQLLSFPLLCLANYFTFKYSIPRDVPVRINGDDIVFRANEEEITRWKSNVSKSGLVLSLGKTMEHKRFFSLNSSMFDARQGQCDTVPFVRPKALWGSGENMPERISSLRSRFRSFLVGMGKRRASEFRRMFLRENIATIYRCRRSLTRGMGMSVSEWDLKDCGLWHRELFYLEQVQEPPMPFWSFAAIKSNNLPTGWTRVSPYRHNAEVVRGWQFRLSHEITKLAWSQPVVTDSLAKKRWMDECDAGCSQWGLAGFATRRMCKLVKMTRRKIWRWICLRTNSSVFGRCRFNKGQSVLAPCTALSHDGRVEIIEE
nr:MAG: RNA-dependent RNA polymerase [Lwood associated botourmia-like virus 3]